MSVLPHTYLYERHTMANTNKRGPSTPQGKEASSRNSTKQGIYSNSLLPNESVEEAQEFAEGLMQEWCVQGVEAQSLARLYVQSLLKTSRLHACEVSLIQTQMYSRGSREAFALQARIREVDVADIPDWYFSDDDQAKHRAIQRGGAVEEAARLASRYSLVQSLEAKTLFPQLWAELNDVTVGSRLATLSEMLELFYGQGSPQANLQGFVQDYAERFKFDLLWASSWRSFESYIESIRARHVLNLTSNAEWVKVEGLQHRRRAEITQQALFLSKSQLIQPPPRGQLLDLAGAALDAPEVQSRSKMNSK